MDSELNRYYQELGIGAEHLKANRLPFCQQVELNDLEVADIDFAGRAFVILKSVAKPWREMRLAATSENVLLQPASGFRTYLYQVKLIEGQLTKGRPIAEILTSNAIPGFSEHHTGRAVDIIADPSVPESAFHETDTFQWLLENASRFGFRLSFPKDNPYGIIFEPWHWFYEGK